MGFEPICAWPSLVDKYREFLPWVSIDGFNVAGTDGYVITPRGAFLRMDTPASLNAYCYIAYKSSMKVMLKTGKLYRWDIPIVWEQKLTNQVQYIRMGDTVADPPSETVDHFGWKIIDDSIYASNADGTTQKITDTGVDIKTGGQLLHLRVDVLVGVSCKFYIDNVLKVTHTDNVPNDFSYFLHVYLKTTDSNQIIFGLGRAYIEKDY